MKKNAAFSSLPDSQKTFPRSSLLFAALATGLCLPLASSWAATWPTPVAIAGSLQTAVTALNTAIANYASTPSEANLLALNTAEANYRTEVQNASAAAVLSVNINDSIVPPKLTIPALNAASIQASGGAELTIQGFNNPTGGAIALSGGAALDLSAQPGAVIVFRSNSSNLGGAINNNNSTLSITGTRFEQNTSPNTSGAIDNNNGGEVSITSSTFEGNTGINGGAIRNTNSSMGIVNSIFINNSSPVGSSGGGALHINTNSTVSITGSIFNDNQNPLRGGAIFSEFSVLTIIDSSLNNNTSPNAGGAVDNSQGTANIISSTFTGNTASYGGAIRNSTNSTMNISNSSFDNNIAFQQGGAILSEGPSTINITDSSFTNNSAGLAGGAMDLHAGVANFTVNSGRTMLFSGNTANGQPSSISLTTFFPAETNDFNVNVADNGLFDMQDPMGTQSLVNNTTISIEKTGAGVWALGGANNFGSTTAVGHTDFSILAGRLYLYGGNELPNVTAATLQLDGANSTFRVESGAELVAGGDNAIETEGTISFADGSTLRGGNASFALGGEDPSRHESGGGATSLSLTAAGGVLLEGAVQLAALSAGDTFTVNGVLGGTGGLNKIGDGLAILTGANAYQGATNVNAGILRINGNQALATGLTTVNAGGTLEGSGILGGDALVSAGGSISPGNGINSIGTLSILGNYTQAAGSFYQTDLNPQGNSDLISVQGSATINGGTVNTTGMYSLGTRYTIVEAQQGVSGVYAALTHNNVLSQNLPFLSLQLIYDPTHVYLDVLRNDVSFCDYATTPNECNTGNGVESSGPDNPVYNAVANLASGSQAPQALNALSGEGYSSTLGLMMEESRYVREATLNRLSQYADKPASHLTLASWNALNANAVDLKKDWAWWMQGYGAWGELDGNRNAAKVDRSTRGFFLGADHWLGEKARLGIVAGYSRSDLDLDARRTSADLDNYTIGVYGGTTFQQLAFRAGAAYTKHDVDMSRSVQFSGFSNQLSADYDAHTAQAFAELGYTVNAQRYSFEPFAGLAYVDVDASRWREVGGTAALTGKGSFSTTYSTLGLREAGLFYRGERVLVDEQITLGWRHAYDNLNPQAAMAFLTGSSPFEIYGAPIAEDALMVDAGLSWSTLPRNLNFRLAYNGQLASEATDHSVTARLAWQLD